MWQKLTWMLFGQKSTGAALRKLWGCWFISGRMRRILFEILSTSLPPAISLSLWPPPSLRPLSKHSHTHTGGDKSHCEPGQFPVLMTSCLQTHRTVLQGSWSLTPSHSVCLSLVSYPYIQTTFDLMNVQFSWKLKMDGARLGTLCCNNTN